ncbi:MAG: SGNH/GDSL hydrolase family protein [Chloroflexi bacterium]|nr:SGNH/GDSL hydrolase family protein [Chloroflexota bacterium]
MTSSIASAPLRFVALGDSYTIGTGVTEPERWPNQLVEALRGRNGEPVLDLVANLGVNGWTSRDVHERQVPRLATLDPGFVSLLVGVNDVVQGVPPAVFERTAAAILDEVLALVPPSRVLVVATPDYTVTPAGADYGEPNRAKAGIIENNRILRGLAEARGIAFVDIFDISGEAATDRGLVARDGLHPSGAQYARWVERIAMVVRDLLG